MAYEFRRNIKDAQLTTTRALTASDGSVTSSDLDLGANPKDCFPEGVEIEVAIDSLSGTELASADTLIVLLQHGDSAAPTTAFAPSLTTTITGTGSTIAAQTLRYKLPPDVNRYLNVKFTTSGTTGDMSDKNAVIRVLV